MVDAPLETREFTRRVVTSDELETLFPGPIHAGAAVVDKYEPSARCDRSEVTGKLAGRSARRRRIPSQENGANRMPGTSASITGVTGGALQPFGGPGCQSPRDAPTHLAIRSGRSVAHTRRYPQPLTPRGNLPAQREWIIPSAEWYFQPTVARTWRSAES